MRILIVGGGIIGLLTALECARLRHQVVLIDRASLPNPLATSHDRHRVLRALHPGDAEATSAAVTAHRSWLELEHQLATIFYHVVGALSVIPSDRLAESLELLAQASAHSQAFMPNELAARYPQIVFPVGRPAILEQHAGVLLADRILAALVRRLSNLDSVLLCPGLSVVRVDASQCKVELADGRIWSADRIVLATGPQTTWRLGRQVVGNVALYRQTMLYCRIPRADRARWATIPAAPTLGTSEGAWLVPPVGSTPLKLSAHAVCRVVSDVTGTRPAHESVDLLTIIGLQLINGFKPDWIIGARDCYYSRTSATRRSLLVGFADGRVVAHVACGGGAFKFAPLIAQSIARGFDSDTFPPDGLCFSHWSFQVGALLQSNGRDRS